MGGPSQGEMSRQATKSKAITTAAQAIEHANHAQEAGRGGRGTPRGMRVPDPPPLFVH